MYLLSVLAIYLPIQIDCKELAPVTVRAGSVEVHVKVGVYSLKSELCRAACWKLLLGGNLSLCS